MCPSSWSCEKLIENGTPKDAAYPLPYPIDLDLFKPLPASTQSNNSTKTLIWLGRSVPRKRLDLLMKSLEIVFEKHPDYRLLIVGHFSFTPEYSKLIENFTFKDRVEHIQGVARQDVPDLIRSSMLCVQPSEYENFGSAVAEALACGVASVIGPTNGTGDFTADACFRFDEYTVESLSETLLEAIETVEKNQQELAVKARKTAEENLELAKVVDRLEEILEIASQKHHS